ncbi:hypothetical protein [Streptomyces caeruleatus]|nr:hypothetical protein [Streptomyces caeruleatus]
MDLKAALATHRLVAIVRGDDPDAALRTVLGGVLKVPHSTHGARHAPPLP